VTSKPPGTFGVVWILARAAARRAANRFGGGLAAFRVRKKKRPRKTKRGGMGLKIVAVVIFGGLFTLQAVQISAMCVGGISNTLQLRMLKSGDAIPLSDYAYRMLAGYGSTLAKLESDMSRADDAEKHDAVGLQIDDTKKDIAERLRKEAGRLALPSRFDLRMGGFDDTDLSPAEKATMDAKYEELARIFDEKGIAGFKRSTYGRAEPWPSLRLWPPKQAISLMTRAIGIVLTLVFVAVTASSLGMANRDLGKVEWDMEWLWTFPVSPGSLFLSRILERGLVNLFGWIINVPFIFVVLWSAGYRWWAVPLAFLAGTSLNLVTASAWFLAEVWLRTHVNLSRVKAVQAVLTIVGAVALFAVMALGLSGAFTGALVRAAQGPAGLLMWLPWALPAAIARGGFTAAGATAALAAAAVAAAAGTARYSQGLTSAGIVTDQAVYKGARGKPARAPKAGWLKGITGKDVKLLLRDKALAARTLVLPLVMVAFQLFLNPRLLSAGKSDPRNACAIAFGVGAVVLLSGGFSALMYETKGLWLLYTFPTGLTAIMRRKATLWWGIASAYTAAFLVIAFARGRFGAADFLPAALSALAGVLPVAFIAVGLGALGTDPQAVEEQQRMSVWVVYLYMLVGGAYMPVIYVPWLWLKLIMYAVYGTIAFAIWKHLGTRLPYLLDPA